MRRQKRLDAKRLRRDRIRRWKRDEFQRLVGPLRAAKVQLYRLARATRPTEKGKPRGSVRREIRSATAKDRRLLRREAKQQVRGSAETMVALAIEQQNQDRARQAEIFGWRSSQREQQRRMSQASRSR